MLISVLQDYYKIYVEGKQNWSETRTDKLRRDLLRFYDRHSRPVINDNLTNVTVNTVLKYVDLVSTTVF